MSAGLAGFARGLREMAPVGASFVDELAASQKVRDRSDRLAYADQVGKLEEEKYKAKAAGAQPEWDAMMASPISRNAYLSSIGVDPSVVGGMETWKQRTGASKPASTPEDTSATSSLASKIAQAYEPPAQQAATTQSVSSVSDSGGKQATYPVNQQDQGSLAQMTLNNAMRRKELDDRMERGTAKGDEARMRALISAGGGAEDVSMLSSMAGVSRSAVSDLRAENKDITGNRLGSAEKVFGTESQALAANTKNLADIQAAKVGQENDLDKIRLQGAISMKLEALRDKRARDLALGKGDKETNKLLIGVVDQLRKQKGDLEKVRPNFLRDLKSAKGNTEKVGTVLKTYSIPTEYQARFLGADLAIPNFEETEFNKMIGELEGYIANGNRALVESVGIKSKSPNEEIVFQPPPK